MELTEDSVLDCRGLLCPMPVVRIGREFGGLAPGWVVKVLATDRGSVSDVPAWIRDTGNELLAWHQTSDHMVFYIRKGAGED